VAAAGVPFSNTGQKIKDDHPLQSDETVTSPVAIFRSPQGFELDAEWVELFTNGKRLIPVKTPIPYDPGVSNAALIDWLAFTVRPSESEDHKWVIRELQALGILGSVEELNGGYAGYAHKAQYQDNKTRLCLIAWGGKNQAATVYVSFPGHGCARIKNWPAVRAWLEQYKATITRLDLAYDDFQAERISINPAVEWYQSGGFGAGGRMPGHRVHGDWLLGDQSKTGRTLEIGSREGGKLCRVYEKGKQLGDPENPWVRVEVEWHNESRHIPYEALTNPGRYLAGAYECLHFLDQEQSRIQTQQRAAKVSFDYAMYNGRRLAGKLVNLALEVYQGDYAEVVEQLRREGYPARVEPYMRSVGDTPEMLAEEDMALWEGMAKDTPHPTRGERSA
jgi:phage replication initiation protein